MLFIFIQANRTGPSWPLIVYKNWKKYALSKNRKKYNLHENEHNQITVINESSIMTLKINAKYIKHKNEA